MMEPYAIRPPTPTHPTTLLSKCHWLLLKRPVNLSPLPHRGCADGPYFFEKAAEESCTNVFLFQTYCGIIVWTPSRLCTLLEEILSCCSRRFSSRMKPELRPCSNQSSELHHRRSSGSWKQQRPRFSHSLNFKSWNKEQM